MVIKNINELSENYKVKIEESSKKLAEMNNCTAKKFDEYGLVVIMRKDDMSEVYAKENDFRIDELKDLNMYSLKALQLADAAFNYDGKLIKNRCAYFELTFNNFLSMLN